VVLTVEAFMELEISGDLVADLENSTDRESNIRGFIQVGYP
jgi:hypothetical protein